MYNWKISLKYKPGIPPFHVFSGQNCETLNLGVNTWKEFALDIDRHYHTSWSRPSGAILFGGWSHEAQISAVKVTGTKHSTAFSLSDET